MNMRKLLLLLCVLLPASVYAEKPVPWGTAKDQHVEYKPAKVVYDLTSGKPGRLENVLDRASLLSKLYGADPFESSIVIVLHGDVIPLFSLKNFSQYSELMKRAYNLSVAGVVEFRMCKASAKARHSLAPKDIHGFVTMIPMADAELARLQIEEGYAYIR